MAAAPPTAASPSRRGRAGPPVTPGPPALASRRAVPHPGTGSPARPAPPRSGTPPRSQGGAAARIRPRALLRTLLRAQLRAVLLEVRPPRALLIQAQRDTVDPPNTSFMTLRPVTLGCEGIDARRLRQQGLAVSGPPRWRHAHVCARHRRADRAAAALSRADPARPQGSRPRALQAGGRRRLCAGPPARRYHAGPDRLGRRRPHRRRRLRRAPRRRGV